MIATAPNKIDPAVLQWTQGKRVLMVGGQGARPLAHESLIEELQIAHLDWPKVEVTGSKRFWSQLADNVSHGHYDLLIYLTRFTPHASMIVAKAAREIGMPVVMANGGYNPGAIARAITSCLKDATPKAPVNPPKPEESEPMDLYIQAFAWLREHPEATFAEFRVEYDDPFLDNAWFAAQKKKLLPASVPAPIPIPIPTPIPTPGEPPKEVTVTRESYSTRRSQDRTRVDAYLANLSDEELRDITHRTYERKVGHIVASNLFCNAKFTEVRARKGVRRKSSAATNHAAAPVRSASEPIQNKRTEPIQNKRTLIEVIARIEAADLPTNMTLPEIKAFVRTLAKALHPRGDQVEVVLLSDPSVIELRAPA